MNKNIVVVNVHAFKYGATLEQLEQYGEIPVYRHSYFSEEEDYSKFH